MAESGAAVQKAKEAVAVKTTTSDAFIDRMNDAFNTISRRAFEIFESNGRLPGHDLEDWSKAENELFHPLHIDVTESDESVSVKAEVPGFSEKNLEVTIEPGRMTISGRRESSRQEKKGATIYSETCSNEVFRVVELPAEVDTGKATATLNNGILQFSAPKAAKARSLQIRPQNAA